MDRAKTLFTCAFLLLAWAARGDARDAGSIDDEKPVDSDQAKVIIAERLGVQVTVAEAHQINARPPLRKYRGGLFVVLVTGPLAKVAGLRVGDAIVLIDESNVPDFNTALRALDRADESAGKTRLTIVRRGKVVQAEIMVGPATRQLSANASTATLTSEGNQPSLRQYLEKSALLIEEQQELERLEQAKTYQVRRLPLLVRQLDLYHQQLLALQNQIADAGALRDALVAQRETLELQIEKIEKEIPILTVEKTAEQIQAHRVRLRVLEHSLDKTIKELRLAGKHREQN